MSISKTLAALALGATITASGWAADVTAPAAEGSKKMTIETAPAAVQEGIKAGLAGGTVKSIEETKKDGKVAYKVQVTTADGKTVNNWYDDKGVMIKDTAKDAAKDAAAPATK